MTDRLQLIRPRLQELARLDAYCQLFGAAKHRYQLEPPLTKDEVRVFELLHGVRLPEDYRAFLLSVGGSGAGPHYGLLPLGNFDHAVGRFADTNEESDGWSLDNGLPADFLSSPFPAGRGWVESPETEEVDDDEANALLEEWEVEAWDDKWIRGTLYLSDFGCNIRDLLVVSGDERGYMWRDARCDCANLRALKPNTKRIASSPQSNYVPMFLEAEGGETSFLDWYEWWLDWTLEEAKSLSG